LITPSISAFTLLRKTAYRAIYYFLASLVMCLGLMWFVFVTAWAEPYVLSENCLSVSAHGIKMVSCDAPQRSRITSWRIFG
jgi:hypothetical protein